MKEQTATLKKQNQVLYKLFSCDGLCIDLILSSIYLSIGVYWYCLEASTVSTPIAQSIPRDPTSLWLLFLIER